MFPREVRIGGMSREALVAEVESRGIQLNDHARTLLRDAAFDAADEETVRVVVRTVAELGLASGGTLPQVYAAAIARGLDLCPVITGPYLRLAVVEQAASSESTLSVGSAPQGSLTVATPALRNDVEYPRGFYLRVVDGVPWLRGYRCDDGHVWSPEDAFVFRG